MVNEREYELMIEYWRVKQWDWLEAVRRREDWRSCTAECGVQCVTICSTTSMHKSPATCSATGNNPVRLRGAAK